MVERRSSEPDFDRSYQRAYKQAVRDGDPEQYARIKERNRASYKRDPSTWKRLDRLHKTGHTPEMVAALRQLQDGRCAICDLTLVVGGIGMSSECADHTEIDGKKIPRGLLCARCNLALGHYEAHKHRHARFEEYIQNYPARRVQCPK